jgi:tol-pal system protein YbgF
MLALCACVTTKQEGEEMRARIDRLEKDLKAERESTAAQQQKLAQEQQAKLAQVQEAMDALNRAARKSGADLAVDLEKAQNDLSQIHGTIEVIQHRLDQIEQANADRDKKIDANAQFVQQRQKEMTHPTDKVGLYNLARQKLDEGDTGAARQLFGEFLQRYKNDEMAANAQYWLGETYYADKRYNDAIVEFQKVVKQYKGSDKAPDALLKIGMSFQAQKDCKNALLFYEEVTQAHKGAPAANTAKEKQRECRKRTASKRK